MQIFLLRHGIAEDARPGQPDASRALTEEGRDKLRRVLKRARAAGVAPDAILSSPLRRAIETAEVAAEVLSYKGVVERIAALEPDASPYDLWEAVRSRGDETSQLLSGHEPLMSSMVAFLLDHPGMQVDMKKAALVRVDCDHTGPKPRGVLKWMITPAVSA